MEYPAIYGEFSLISLWRPDPTGLYGKGMLTVKANAVTFTGKKMMPIFFQLLIFLGFAIVGDVLFGMDSAFGGIIGLIVIGIFGRRPYHLDVPISEFTEIQSKDNKILFYISGKKRNKLVSQPKSDIPSEVINSLIHR